MKSHYGTIDFAWVQPSVIAAGNLGDSSAMDRLLARPLGWLATPDSRVGTDPSTSSSCESSVSRCREIVAAAKSIGVAALASPRRPGGLDGCGRQPLLAHHLDRPWNDLERRQPPIDEDTPPTGPALDLEGRERGFGPKFRRDAKFVALVLASRIEGHRGSHPSAPAWLRLGSTQSLALAVDPSASNARVNEDASMRSRSPTGWWELRRRTRHDAWIVPAAHFEADLARRDLAGASRAESVRVWANVEFLGRGDGESPGSFLLEQKAQFPADSSKSASEALVARRRGTVERILDFADPAAFEAAWDSSRPRRMP